MNIDFAYLFTSLEGRIGRRDWWVGTVTFIIISIVVVWVIIGGLFGMFSTFGRILLFIFGLVLAYPQYCLSGKRFHDRDKPAEYALILIGLAILKNFLDLIGVTGDPFAMSALDYILSIPLLIVAIWFLVELGFLRGTVGANQYGPDPLESLQPLMR